VVDIIKTFIIHVVNTNLFDYIFLEVKSIDDIFLALIEDDAPLFAHPEQISHFPSHSNKIIYADKLIIRIYDFQNFGKDHMSFLFSFGW